LWCLVLKRRVGHIYPLIKGRVGHIKKIRRIDDGCKAEDKD